MPDLAKIVRSQLSLTLYLVQDEAHRGFGSDVREKSTIVKRLINGEKGVPPIPVVWGISATIDRFNKAMEGASNRVTLPPVTVDVAAVQESGLLKGFILLDIPNEEGDFDSVRVRRATEKLRESTNEWATYGKQQGGEKTVAPQMVSQVPNTPNHNKIGKLLDAMFQEWPELPTKSIANVFGEHTTERF